MPNEMIEAIQRYADENGWSFSRTLCYLTHLGIVKLWELGLMDIPIEFDVDKPTRKMKRQRESDFDA